MKKSNLLNKILVLLVAAGVTASLFAGCQSKNAQAQNNTATSTNAGNAGNTANIRPNADEMKKQMEDNIKSLVTDGTITQDQADKIVAALTENIQRPNGNGANNQQNNQQTNQQNNQQNNGQGSGQGNGNRQNRQGNNRLSQLVTDGVITQAQADAVMQKIRGNFQGQQRNRNQQNNQNQQNQPSNQTSGT